MSEGRCSNCGRFLTYEDRSTESGYDFEEVCYNPKCIESAKDDEKHIIEDMGKFVAFCEKENSNER